MYNTVSLYICLLNLRKATSLCLAELFHLWEVIYSFWTVGQGPRKISSDWHFFCLVIQLSWSEMHNHISLFKFYSMTRKHNACFPHLRDCVYCFQTFLCSVGITSSFILRVHWSPYQMGGSLKVLAQLTHGSACSSEQATSPWRKG